MRLGFLLKSHNTETPSGQRWITIHPNGSAEAETEDEEGNKVAHKDYRRILISDDGEVLGGDIPRSDHGKNIDDVFSNHDVDESPYSDYSFHELHESYTGLKQAYQEARSELRDLVHETAEYLQEMDETKHGTHRDLVRQIRSAGGIRAPRKGNDAHATEYHESVAADVRRAIGNKEGRALDDVADELGMSSDELVQRLANAAVGKKTAAMSFYRDAEREIERQHGKGYMEKRASELRELDAELKRLHATVKQAARREGRDLRRIAKSFVMKSLSSHLHEMVQNGDAHWVTITDEHSPLHGRHILIGGPRPETGKRSDGPILAGHGIPTHVLHALGGHSSDLNPKTLKPANSDMFGEPAGSPDYETYEHPNPETKMDHEPHQTGFSDKLGRDFATNDATQTSFLEGAHSDKPKEEKKQTKAEKEEEQRNYEKFWGKPDESQDQESEKESKIAFPLKEPGDDKWMEGLPEEEREKPRRFVQHMNKKLEEGNYDIHDVRNYYQWLKDHRQEVLDSYLDFLNNDDRYKRKRKATKQELAEKQYNGALRRLSAADGQGYMWNPFGGGSAEDAMHEKIRNLTEEGINEHKRELQAEREKHEKSMTNPETIEELRHKMVYGGGLTPEEQEGWDELTADRRREQQKEPETKKVAETSADVGGFDISKTKHTKTGQDIWVAKPKNRVSKEEYKELNSKMKQLGGYYSRFVHGFVFDKDPKEALEGLLDGGAQVENQKASEEYKQEKSQSAAERLRSVADNMQSTIDNKRADRLTNTARRAAMAASAEADADQAEKIQTTMRNIADAIENGDAKHLDGLRTRAQVETLDRILDRQKWENDHQAGVSYEKSRGRAVIREDIRNVEFPKPHANVDALLRLAHGLRDTGGVKRTAQQLTKMAESARQKGNYSFDFEHGSRAYEDVEKLIRAAQGKPDLKYEAQRLSDGLTESKRLHAMGTETSEQLRAALREFMDYRGGGISAEEQKRRELRDLEAQSTRQNIAGFFPTPSSIAHDMVRQADIKPGMKVLEPSAGKGNIADAIKEHHPEAELDTVEYNHGLREILEHKGHRVVGSDFLQHKDEYDRIVMNPPFENGQDIDHVQHAYEMLKPGGKLVAIMSESPFFRSGTKAEQFRNWLESHGGQSEKLPEGAFKNSERSTGVNTRMVVITKPKTDIAPHLLTQREATKAEKDDFQRKRADPGTFSGVMRRGTERQRERARQRAEHESNSSMEALDKWNEAKEAHKQAVHEAVKNGDLSREQYERLHSGDYGSYDEAVQRNREQEEKVRQAAEMEERKNEVHAAAKQSIEDAQPGQIAITSAFGPREIVRVNKKTISVKTHYGTEAIPKDLIRRVVPVTKSFMEGAAFMDWTQQQWDNFLETGSPVVKAHRTKEEWKKVKKEKGDRYGNEVYADPAHNSYPLTKNGKPDEERTIAAWRYIHTEENGSEYTDEQRKQIEDRIRRFAKKHFKKELKKSLGNPSASTQNVRVVFQIS